MSENAMQLINLFEILPENDQLMLLELTKKMLLAYDPEYTKLLPDEKKAVESALADINAGVNIVDESSINWWFKISRKILQKVLTNRVSYAKLTVLWVSRD